MQELGSEAPPRQPQNGSDPPLKLPENWLVLPAFIFHWKEPLPPPSNSQLPLTFCPPLLRLPLTLMLPEPSVNDPLMEFPLCEIEPE